ncbi:O-methyltransferase [Anaplasmataceae bacterium AB001_6]|nr:O-methyltransferase [Anaplasmataceae bacterium AB001_6]
MLHDNRNISNISKDLKYINDIYFLDSKNPCVENIKNSIVDNRSRSIQISRYEGFLLNFFIKCFNIKNVLEIGTMFGYSAAHIANAIPKEGNLVTIEKNIDNYHIAYDNLRMIDRNINIINGDAIDVLYFDQIIKGHYDMMFIDANKSGYCKYLDWADKHLKKGGLIVADNCFLGGRVYDLTNKSKMVRVMREFNNRIADSDKYESIILPMFDGLCIAIKKF